MIVSLARIEETIWSREEVMGRRARVAARLLGCGVDEGEEVDEDEAMLLPLVTPLLAEALPDGPFAKTVVGLMRFFVVVVVLGEAEAESEWRGRFFGLPLPMGCEEGPAPFMSGAVCRRDDVVVL